MSMGDDGSRQVSLRLLIAFLQNTGLGKMPKVDVNINPSVRSHHHSPIRSICTSSAPLRLIAQRWKIGIRLSRSGSLSAATNVASQDSLRTKEDTILGQNIYIQHREGVWAIGMAKRPAHPVRYKGANSKCQKWRLTGIEG
ncbi:expressed protein [Echinococcus multilocularis]|uniref:Expressed protein n=1 Tax=Echinococcus multilocularis TaxID=6211 RepID=A0A068Y8A3_ECHMU|nr:expressed protein [Echinococcus multilocularis]